MDTYGNSSTMKSLECHLFHCLFVKAEFDSSGSGWHIGGHDGDARMCKDLVKEWVFSDCCRSAMDQLRKALIISIELLFGKVTGEFVSMSWSNTFASDVFFWVESSWEDGSNSLMKGKECGRQPQDPWKLAGCSKVLSHILEQLPLVITKHTCDHVARQPLFT